jgi:hypothetical protein
VKRLPRTLLNALTALSLILFVATVALWVRSYRAAQCWRYAPHQNGFGAGAYAEAGYLCIWRDRDGVFDDPGPGIQYWQADGPRSAIPRGDLRIAGVVFRVGSDAE